MVTTTTYANWKTGDIINICASINEFCGTTNNYIWVYDINVAQSPNTCTLQFGNQGSCNLHLNNVELTFKLVGYAGSVQSKSCAPQQVYKTLGSVRTNSNGVAAIQYTTTDQDRLDYGSATGSGYQYAIMACITNADGQTVLSSQTSVVTNSITIVKNLCQGVICPDICVGNDLYYQMCNPANGQCIQGALKQTNGCAPSAPTVTYDLYFKISDIVPISLITSVLGTVYNSATDAVIDTLAGYYIEGVTFDPNTYILTVTTTSYATSSGIQNLQVSGPAIASLAGSITLAIVFALGFEVVAVVGAIALGTIIVSYLVVTFLGKKESVAGQPPSTRVITLTAEICTGMATNPCSTISPLTPDMIVSVVVNAGNTPQTGNITAASPTATFSVPTNVDVSITAKVKDNPYYTVFSTDSTGYPDLKSCTPGNPCPTTIPITIKLFAQADAKAAPKLADTSGNPLQGKYVLFIEDSRGVKVEDGSGDLVNGQVPQGVIPANKEYCIAIIPSDYPTHLMTFSCSSCSAGEICSPTLVSKTCIESKNSLTVRCVYISSSGARLGFTPDEIDITDISTGTVTKKILPGTPTPGSTCSGVITSDATCTDGLENGKTYKIHVISATFTVTTATQDQQVTYSTDCSGVMLTVEASPPPNTYDVTIQVQNNQTLTALPGAIVTLGTMPAETTSTDGSVMFASVPKGTGISLKVTLAGYKDYSDKIDVTTTQTVTVQMSVNQVLQTIDTRINNFGTIGDIIATKSVKFKGNLEYLDVTTYRPLTDAQITVTVKDKNGTTLQTLSATSQSGTGAIGAGYFETGDWLVSTDLVDTQISATATFDGIGQYKSSTVTTTYAVAKAADCAIPIPFTNSCLLSKETSNTLLMLGGLLIGGYAVYKLVGLVPSRKESVETVTEKREYAVPQVARPDSEIVEIRPIKGATG